MVSLWISWEIIGALNTKSFVEVIEKMMVLAAQVIGDKGLKVYILHASENIHINSGIGLAELT